MPLVDNTMFSLFHHLSKPPSLKQLPLKPYLYNLSLNRLTKGVDNFHFDVHISPKLFDRVKGAVRLLMIEQSKAETFPRHNNAGKWIKEKDELKRLCEEVLMEAVNRAKLESEVQIDFLAQLALAKMLLVEIRNQYEKLIEHLEEFIRAGELSKERDIAKTSNMKKKLAEIKRKRNRIIRFMGDEVLNMFADVQSNNLRNIRESNFPSTNILPDNFYLNPLLHVELPPDDFLLIEKYVLISHRFDDPDNYDKLINLFYDILSKTDLIQDKKNEEVLSEDAENGEPRSGVVFHPLGKSVDPWIMEIGNIDLLFNSYNSREQYKKSKKKKEAKEILRKVKSRAKTQGKLLNHFYRKFNKLRLIERILTAYELLPVYAKYCPPLVPHQVQEYIVNPKARRQIAKKLKSLEAFFRKSFSLSPLQKTVNRIKNIPVRKRKKYLLRFLKHFARYHRDLTNSKILKSAMGSINLVTEEKILNLSKENHTLYEFLLADENVNEQEDKPIINHVVIKADIRGSTDITFMMMNKGLNPASYFSLNFFEPINGILRDYGGTKQFIEGDAVILSIIEHQDKAEDWYCVARACGLAIKILHIVQQYNIKSRKHNLPILELGIGICYSGGAPVFLFDGDDRIMISPAINKADRLSSCAKSLRKIFNPQKRLFRLSVFQTLSKEDSAATADDLHLRYNVNGIELNPEGFEKLSREISLKSIIYSTSGKSKEKVKLYTGKVPTKSGNYQRLVIREADLFEISPETLKVVRKTSGKFYEVCTHRKIYEYIENQI